MMERTLSFDGRITTELQMTITKASMDLDRLCDQPWNNHLASVRVMCRTCRAIVSFTLLYSGYFTVAKRRNRMHS